MSEPRARGDVLALNFNFGYRYKTILLSHCSREGKKSSNLVTFLETCFHKLKEKTFFRLNEEWDWQNQENLPNSCSFSWLGGFTDLSSVKKHFPIMPMVEKLTETH